MWRYHGIDIGNNPEETWIIQELIHLKKPARVIIIGDQFGGMAAWVKDCMAADLLFPFVINVSNYERPKGMDNYRDVTWVVAPPDETAVTRIKRSLGAPCMVIVNRWLTPEQIEVWKSLITDGQYLIFVDEKKLDSLPCYVGFRRILLFSDYLRAYEKMPVSVLAEKEIETNSKQVT